MAKRSAAPGVPGWMVTFADLMALMMTFFVLLYSFSTIDEKKYRMIVQSMAQGFGSTSISRQSAGRNTAIAPPSPIPSPLNQQARAPSPTPRPQSALRPQDPVMNRLQNAMSEQISEGAVALETSGNAVVIRLPEEIAFPPGSDTVSDELSPLLRDVAAALADAPGTIVVSGHTDDRPIQSPRFSSNWELSTDRAVAVLEALQQLGGIDGQRLTAVGYGDTRPIAPNDTVENRARNRRVEIAIVREQD